jgi:Zn finger protein HypA/HybF involved in hydrogenase expression
MHESTMLSQLIGKIADAARRHGASRVKRVKMHLGALVPISVEHLQEHFAQAAVGSLAADAVLDVEVGEDPSAADALSIIMTDLELET